MENTVKERLKMFLKEAGIKAVDFCRSIDVSSGFISGMRESIQPDKLKSIAIKYPCLDIGWLMTGEGDMFKDKLLGDHVSTSISGNVSGGITGNKVSSGNITGNGNNVGILPSDCEKELLKAQCEVDYLKKENKSLKEQLKQAIADKEKAISMLEKALNR